MDVILFAAGILGSLAYWLGREQILPLPPNSETHVRPVVENITVGWLPPELPPGCSNVFESCGGFDTTNSIFEAKIPPSGETLRLEDLPPVLRNRLPKDWVGDFVNIKRDELATFKPKSIDLFLHSPIYPYVKNNRLFVYVSLPFKNEKHIILMCNDLDSEIPHNWDRNYNSNAFEIVSEDGLPVLQVFYKRPDYIQVNGIFVCDTNYLFVAFGTHTEIHPISVVSASGEVPTVHIILGAESILFSNTELIYTTTFSNQAAIFKYPSWRHLGEYAN